MSTNNDSFIINPSLKIDHVHLRVSDMQKSIKFYQSILGFRVLKNISCNDTVFLTSASITDNGNESSQPLVVLTQIDSNSNMPNHSNTKRRKAGLYHFAILLPNKKSLASFLHHMQKKSRSQILRRYG